MSTRTRTLPLVTLPLLLVVTGALKARGERSGSSTIEGAAKRVADQIAARLALYASRTARTK